jgi:hypothetical protein
MEVLVYQLGDVTTLYGHERWARGSSEVYVSEDLGGLLTFSTWHPADRLHRAISINCFGAHACLNGGQVGGRNNDCDDRLTSVQTLIDRVSFVKRKFPLGDLHHAIMSGIKQVIMGDPTMQLD